jgi:hypothetical protein
LQRDDVCATKLVVLQVDTDAQLMWKLFEWIQVQVRAGASGARRCQVTVPEVGPPGAW